MSQSGGIPQVDVPVAAHELRQHLERHGLLRGVAMTVASQLLPNRLQSVATLGPGRQVCAHRVGGQRLVERVSQRR
jgi:hypothetical protein